MAKMAKTKQPEKVYIGDGAYAEYDGNGINLTAENGICVTNTVYLEPEVAAQLVRFMQKHFGEDNLARWLAG